jgi:hypothetical protein
VTGYGTSSALEKAAHSAEGVAHLSSLLLFDAQPRLALGVDERVLTCGNAHSRVHIDCSENARDPPIGTAGCSLAIWIWARQNRVFGVFSFASSWTLRQAKRAARLPKTGDRATTLRLAR